MTVEKQYGIHSFMWASKSDKFSQNETYKTQSEREMFVLFLPKSHSAVG